nr:hypothetical protein [Tanacetum cinerariifolium]
LPHGRSPCSNYKVGKGQGQKGISSSYALNQCADAWEWRLQYAEKQAKKAFTMSKGKFTSHQGRISTFRCTSSFFHVVSSTAEAAVKSFLDEATGKLNYEALKSLYLFV